MKKGDEQMKKSFTWIIAALLLTSGANAVTPNIALPPFTFTGRVLAFNRKNLAVTSPAAEVRVRKASDGTLLAASRIEASETSRETYRLSIPLTLRETATTATTTTPLVFELSTGEKLYRGTEAVFPTELPSPAGGVVERDIVCGADANHNDVADEYEEAIESMLAYYQAQGRFIAFGAKYNPAADYDGDGYANRSEYLAGTDPFDAADYLRILSFGKSASTPGAWELTFFANSAKTYRVGHAAELKAAAFKPKPFRDVSAGEAEKSLLNTESSEYGVRTLVVWPVADESGFYRIEAE